MSGQDMLAGVGGFMQGYRFGRELVGADPDSQKLRAEREAQYLKGLQDQRKAALDSARFGLDVDRLEESRTYHKEQLEGQGEDRVIRQQNATTMARNADISEKRLNRDTQKDADEAAFKESSSNQLGAFTAVMNGTATPEQRRTFDVMAPFVTQDAAKSRERLGAILGRAAARYQSGDVKGADAEFSTPEGVAAINDAAGPFISQQKGMPLDSDGKFVVADTKAVGVIRDAKTNDLAFQLQVVRAPSPQYAEQLRRELSSASPQRKAEINAELQPKPYSTVLTDGRVPLDQGGEIRWFKPQDFQNFIGNMDRLAYMQAQNPEMFDDVRRFVESNAAAENPQAGAKLYLQRSDAAARDTEAKSEKARDNARQDQRDILKGIDGSINGQMPPWSEDGDAAAAKRLRLSNVRARAYDAVLSGKANNVNEALKMAEQSVGSPVADRVRDIMAGARPMSDQTTSFPPSVREIGERYRRGEISEQQAREELKQWGYQ